MLVSLYTVYRFRPISAAHVTNSPVKSTAENDVDVDVDDSRQNVTGRVTGHDTGVTCPRPSSLEPSAATSRRSSRTLLLPSPSSAFSVPATRHTDTVPPTTCRNVDVDLSNIQTDGTADTGYRYRRRATVKEMAQSYDRATQNDASRRRLSYTFRPTLPTSTAAIIYSSVSKPSHATTAETTRNHYTTTSVFSLSKSRRQLEKVDVTKRHETKLRRLHSNMAASLYQSVDNITRLDGPFSAATDRHTDVQESAATSQLELRRSASSQHITDVHAPAQRTASSSYRNNNNNNNMATFPLSIHRLANLSAQNFRQLVEPEMDKRGDDITGSGADSTSSKNDRKHSYTSWKILGPATERSDSGKTGRRSSFNLVATDMKMRHDTETTKTAEMKVMLDSNVVVEPVTSSRCLTVRKSPSLLLASSTSLHFVSPRPRRKVMNHLQPTSASASTARPTSAAALELFNDVKAAHLPSTASDGQVLKSSSPCKTLIELVRESHLSAFPSSNLAPPSPVRSSSTSWMMTSSHRGQTTSTDSGRRLSQHGAISNDRDVRDSYTAATSVLATNDNSPIVRSASSVSHLHGTPAATSAMSVATPLNASVLRLSPSAQPQRARIGVISPHVNSHVTSLTTTATTTTTYTSLAHPQVTPNHRHHHRHHHQNLFQTTSDIVTRIYPGYKGNMLQTLSVPTSSPRQLQVLTSSSSLSAAAAAAAAVKLATSPANSTLHTCVTSLIHQTRPQGQVQRGLSSRPPMEINDESLLTNGFVTAALDCAIERLTLHQPHKHLSITTRHQVKASDLAEFGYDLIDEEPTPVVPDKCTSEDHKSSQKQEHPDQVSSSKKDGGKTVTEELQAIQRRRTFQLQCKDDSFDKPAPPDDGPDTTAPPGESSSTITALPLPRDSVIARYRRRRAARRGVTSSSSSSRDTMTSSSSSSRDTSPDGSSETQQSPLVIARRTLRRRQRLRDPA